MTNKNSLSGLEDLDKKFGVIGVLLFLSEGILGLIFYFIFNDIIYLGMGITFLVVGLIFVYVIQKKVWLKIMPDKMPLAIFLIIYLIIIGIIFYFITNSYLKTDIIASLYCASIPLTWAGLFTIWTILLKNKKE